jgi:hypothetical protein
VPNWTRKTFLNQHLGLSLHEIISDNGVTAVSFAISKNLTLQVERFRIVTFINLLQLLLTERLTTKLT